MSARTQGPMSTILLLVPLTAVPMFAIFGIPQLAPVPPLVDGVDQEPEWPGQSASLGMAAEFPDAEPLPAGISRDVSPQQHASQPNSFYDNRMAGGYSSVGNAENSAESRSVANSTLEGAKIVPVGYQNSMEPAEVGTQQQFGDFPADPLTGGQSRSMPSDMSHFEDATPFSPSQPNSSTRQESPATGNVGLTSISTWDEAFNRLEALGIAKYRLEPARNPREFLFVCSLATDDSSRITRRFEAVATDPLQAVTQVIAQIETWTQR